MIEETESPRFFVVFTFRRDLVISYITGRATVYLFQCFMTFMTFRFLDICANIGWWFWIWIYYENEKTSFCLIVHSVTDSIELIVLP